MKKVTGLGGVFYKCDDPEKLRDWYRDQLGIQPDEHGYISFHWREHQEPETEGFTALGLFKKDTDYFNPSTKPFMVNFRVADLHGLLAELRKAGVTVDDKVSDDEYGRFGWIMDPEGNRIELWEPPAPKAK